MQAIRIDAGQVFTNRGNAWRSKNKLDKAIADYTRAIKIDPTDADAWNNRGAALSEQNQIDRAMSDTGRRCINPKF